MLPSLVEAYNEILQAWNCIKSSDVAADGAGAEVDSAGEAWAYNMCVADELGPWGLWSSILSGTPIRATTALPQPPPPSPQLSARCTVLHLLLIWGIHLHYSAALRLHSGYRMREIDSGRRGRETVDCMMKEGHHGAWCFVLYYLLYEATCPLSFIFHLSELVLLPRCVQTIRPKPCAVRFPKYLQSTLELQRSINKLIKRTLYYLD